MYQAPNGDWSAPILIATVLTVLFSEIEYKVPSFAFLCPINVPSGRNVPESAPAKAALLAEIQYKLITGIGDTYPEITIIDCVPKLGIYIVLPKLAIQPSPIKD